MNHHPQGKPRFLMENKPEPRVEPAEWSGMGSQPKIIWFDRWAERLWPCMAWSIFLFNLMMAIHFGWEIWYDQHYDYAQHVTTAATMCASYIALIWTHKNILRKDNGLD